MHMRVLLCVLVALALASCGAVRVGTRSGLRLRKTESVVTGTGQVQLGEREGELTVEASLAVFRTGENPLEAVGEEMQPKVRKVAVGMYDKGACSLCKCLLTNMRERVHITLGVDPAEGGENGDVEGALRQARADVCPEFGPAPFGTMCAFVVEKKFDAVVRGLVERKPASEVCEAIEVCAAPDLNEDDAAQAVDADEQHGTSEDVVELLATWLRVRARETPGEGVAGQGNTDEDESEDAREPPVSLHVGWPTAHATGDALDELDALNGDIAALDHHYDKLLDPLLCPACKCIVGMTLDGLGDKVEPGADEVEDGELPADDDHTPASDCPSLEGGDEVLTEDRVVDVLEKVCTRNAVPPFDSLCDMVHGELAAIAPAVVERKSARDICTAAKFCGDDGVSQGSANTYDAVEHKLKAVEDRKKLKE